jgi:hypothetical protein
MKPNTRLDGYVNYINLIPDPVILLVISALRVKIPQSPRPFNSGPTGTVPAHLVLGVGSMRLSEAFRCRTSTPEPRGPLSPCELYSLLVDIC